MYQIMGCLVRIGHQKQHRLTKVYIVHPHIIHIKYSWTYINHSGTAFDPLQQKMCHPPQSVFKQHPKPTNCLPWAPRALWSSHHMHVWICCVSVLTVKQTQSLLHSRKCISSFQGLTPTWERRSTHANAQKHSSPHTSGQREVAFGASCSAPLPFSSVTRSLITYCIM